MFGKIGDFFASAGQKMQESIGPVVEWIQSVDNGIRSFLGLETAADKAAASTSNLSKEAEKGAEAIRALTQQAESFSVISADKIPKICVICRVLSRL